MKALLLILAVAICSQAQQSTIQPDQRLIEIQSEMRVIQVQIDALNRRQSELEKERLEIVHSSAPLDSLSRLVIRKLPGANDADSLKRIRLIRATETGSVIVFLDGKQREASLAAIVIRPGQTENAGSFLRHELPTGFGYARCTTLECDEIEIYPEGQTTSLNARMVEMGIADRLSGSSGLPQNSTATEIGPLPSIPQKSTPGTEVQVKGYYRKDGTYVRPHTRSAPRRRN